MTKTVIGFALLLAAAPLLLLSGCARSAQTEAAPAGQQSTKTGGTQSAEAINANIQKVQSDSSLSAERKQIMIDQMKHALPNGKK